MKRLIGYFKDERGVETLEWIVVGALIVAVASRCTGRAPEPARHRGQRDRQPDLGSGRARKTAATRAPRNPGAPAPGNLTSRKEEAVFKRLGRT
jgi:hypothetical protein